MSQPRPTPPALLVIGALVAADLDWPTVPAALRQALGPEAAIRGPLAFDQTNYYEPEIGPGLQRYFIAMADPFDPGRLAETKIATNCLEERFRRPGAGRRVNLDPAALTLANFVLATGKGFAHRPYLGQGIYADLTLMWKQNGWQDLPWTYPDYRTDAVKAILTEFRNYYRGRLRADWRTAVQAPHPPDPSCAAGNDLEGE